MGYAEEYHVTRYFREGRLMKTELLGSHVLKLPKKLLIHAPNVHSLRNFGDFFALRTRSAIVGAAPNPTSLANPSAIAACGAQRFRNTTKTTVSTVATI
jgi:hypothetical protein